MKLVQFGDVHLDAPLEKFTAQTARLLRARARELVSRAVDLAANQGADAILCTGDLFDSPRPYLDSVRYVRDQFAKTDIPVFISPGNHDPFTPSSPWAAVNWPGNVHIFSSPHGERLVLPGFSVTGWANTAQRQSHAPLEGAWEKSDILLFHGEIAEDSPYFHASQAQITASGAGLLAMGHIHGHFTKTLGRTLVSMNGGLQATKFGETGQKGAVIISLDPGEVKADLVPLGGTRCFELAFSDGEIPDLSALCPFPPGDTLLDLTLTGAPLTSREELLAKTEGFLQVRITDLRRAPRELPTGKSLGALFLRRAAETELSLLATEFGLAALENREQPHAEE